MSIPKPPLLELTEALSRASHAGRPIAVVGIGSELRGDDIAGVLVARRVADLGIPDVRGICGYSAPENITGEIITLDPALTIFIDAVDMHKEPGWVGVISLNDIQGISFCTHTLPLPVILAYLSKSTRSEFLLVGIQPKGVDFLEEPSTEALEAVEAVASVFLSQRLLAPQKDL